MCVCLIVSVCAQHPNSVRLLHGSWLTFSLICSHRWANEMYRMLIFGIFHANAHSLSNYYYTHKHTHTHAQTHATPLCVFQSPTPFCKSLKLNTKPNYVYDDVMRMPTAFIAKFGLNLSILCVLLHQTIQQSKCKALFSQMEVSISFWNVWYFDTWYLWCGPHKGTSNELEIFL